MHAPLSCDSNKPNCKFLPLPQAKILKKTRDHILEYYFIILKIISKNYHKIQAPPPLCDNTSKLLIVCQKLHVLSGGIRENVAAYICSQFLIVSGYYSLRILFTKLSENRTLPTRYIHSLFSKRTPPTRRQASFCCFHCYHCMHLDPPNLSVQVASL